MTETTYTTKNGTFTQTEQAIFQTAGAFLLNFKDTDRMICELHEVPTSALLEIYKAVNGSIKACFQSSELPCSVLDILIALVSFLAHEFARRQTEKL
mgnify:CR=1 FL=1